MCYRKSSTARHEVHPDANSVYSSSSHDMIGCHTTNQSVPWKSSKKQHKSRPSFPHMSLLRIFHLQPIPRYRGIFMRRSHFDRAALLCLCQPVKVVVGMKQRGKKWESHEQMAEWDCNVPNINNRDRGRLLSVLHQWLHACVSVIFFLSPRLFLLFSPS